MRLLKLILNSKLKSLTFFLLIKSKLENLFEKLPPFDLIQLLDSNNSIFDGLKLLNFKLLYLFLNPNIFENS